ncbi:MAG TPA: lytic transglycosylase domain-containing protein [Chitinophagaceae bacterium]|jgi:membrane-bound lytic murein transglycosylase D|nr:lytic transglycosylase domain-containing protein [Chitinophagaceae bacterium]
MLKRKLVKAGLFANGLVFFIATVNGADNQQPVDTTTKTTIDPIIRQLQAFDSSFIGLSEFPEIVLTNTPKIRLNSHVVKYVKDYNKKNTESLEKIKEKSTRYFPLIDSIFTNYRLPIELKYLAVIESKLNSKAISHCGAVGPWQLMPSTARDLSLRVKGKYDERTNYHKSTVAAAKYLRDLYREFGDWLLVIAAYNSGPGKVEYAIKKSGSHNFWALQNFLPAETRGHVKRFIATHYYFEGYGSITTLTKKETATYRTAVSEFMAKQKTELSKEVSKNDVTKNDNTNPEKEVTKGINSGEMKLTEQK